MNDDNRKTALTAWRLLYEDDAYRLDHLEDYYKTLMARADELVLRGLLSLEDWQLLKDAADAAYRQTVSSLDRQERDCLKANAMPLPCVD
ncbi:hypothetical protein G7009_25030 [Pseudomonas capeferrum]|uniref:hypothetical protein n=1 Tax=Pseudomonas capeferrum TaxID=1495066 RepID=UPI0015E31AC3|nr:hypothetical protein [Pseudomonas capeferrum]MBA1204985.1 hypothetical protein [Pseudomonas capeferrum]